MKRYLLCLLLVAGLVLLTAAPVLASEPLAMTLRFDRDPVDVSKGESITVIPTVTGGQAPYRYEYRWYNDEQTVWNEYYNHPPQTYTPKFGPSGRVEVTVTDMTNTSVKEIASFTIIGSPPASEVVVELSLDKEEVSEDTGGAITATWEISGGQAPYQCSYTWEMPEYAFPLLQGEAEGVVEVTAPNQPHTCTIMPRLSEYEGGFYITVVDSLGRRQEPYRFFSVHGEADQEHFKKSIEFSVSSADVARGDTVTVTVTATGGVEPYKYEYRTWVYDKDVALQDVSAPNVTTDSSTYTYKPSFGQSGTIDVSVEDSKGNFAVADDWQEWFSITGAPDEPPLVLNVSLDKNLVDLGKGEGITGTWTASGGKPPYLYKWRFATSPTERVHAVASADPVISATYYPESGSGDTVYVEVIDARGRLRRESESFGITGELVRMDGDADGSGTLGVEDLLSILDKILLNKEPPRGANADANRDGAIDIEDALWLIAKLVN